MFSETNAHINREGLSFSNLQPYLIPLQFWKSLFTFTNLGKTYIRIPFVLKMVKPLELAIFNYNPTNTK